jgi:hypothetical protein
MMNANSLNSYARPAQTAQPPSLTPAVQQTEITHFIERIVVKTSALECWMGDLSTKLRPISRNDQITSGEQAPERPVATEVGEALSDIANRLSVLIMRMEAQHNALEI